MEDEKQASKPLPIESFSYSWLVNFPSLENLEKSRRTSLDYTYDVDDSASFIEMDPKLPPSRRFLISPKESFKFDFSVSAESLAHADELFSNGYVMPLFTDVVGSNPAEESQPSDYYSSRPAAKLEIGTVGTTSFRKSKSCRRFQRISKWVLIKYLDFLTPLCRRLRRRRRSSGGDGNGIMTTRNRVYSEEMSPRISVADDWRRSCDSEGSIYEAVLHCKKSFSN